MNKKLLVVAVAGALAAPALAFAQASNVQIYGRINAQFGNYSATGATALVGSAADMNVKGRNRISDQGSKIGFRGTEDLGNGLKASFLCETGVNSDSGQTTGQAGAANTATGTWCSRYGNVGLEGSWGKITYGKSDIWWGNGNNDGVTSRYTEAGVSWTTLGRGMSAGISRQHSTMQYTSPTFNGFNAVVSYSPHAQENIGAVGGQATATSVNADGKTWGITINGAVGNIFGGYDWVKIQNNSYATGNGATGTAYAVVPNMLGGAGSVAGNNSATPTSTGNKFRIGWAYQPGAQVSFIWSKTSNVNWATAATGGLFVAGDGTISQQVYGFSWEHTWGNIHAMAQWNRIKDATGCSGVYADGTSYCAQTGATGMTLAARYLLSKRSDIYLQYTTYRNDRMYNVDYTSAGITSNPGTTAGLPFAAASTALPYGADPRLISLGMSHLF